jgi:hypothetical protein
MKDQEKICNVNSSSDGEYFKLLGNKGYKVFDPKTDSQEDFILKELRKIIISLLKALDLYNVINVKIYLINDEMINAAVCKIGDTYYISLFRGVIKYLKDFVLYFVLENFPHDFFQKKFGKLYINQVRRFEFFEEYDSEHYQLANNIANNILFLIVYHEMGHIFSGHQENIHAEDELFMEANQDKGGNMFAQAKELMADFFSMINALGVYDYSHHDSCEEYTFNHCCYLISLYSLYIYFEKNDYKNKKENTFGTYEELFERSHPHPAIRLLYMIDFLEAETEYGLKELFKVNWLTEDNEKDMLTKIDQTSYSAICEFSLKLPGNFRLINKCYENRSLRIRQLVQNIASDLYEETYRKVAIIKFREIGRISDKYVDEILDANEFLGKYDAIEKDT